MRQIFTKNKNAPDGRKDIRCGNGFADCAFAVSPGNNTTRRLDALSPTDRNLAGFATSAVRRVLAFVVLAALCCVSCRNLIEAPEETAEITESGGTEAAGKLYTLSGAVGAGGAAAKAVSALNSRSAALGDTGGGVENSVFGDAGTADGTAIQSGRAAAANARSATYSPVDGSVISYTVTATNTADSANSPEPLELNPGETTFEIKLLEGTYTLSVEGFLGEGDGKKKILYGEAKNTVTVNDTTPNPPAGTIYVNPIFDGDEPGQVNLAMTISDSCNIKSLMAVWGKLVRDDDGKLKEDESTEETRIFKNVDGSNLTTVQFTMTEESENASDGVSAGFYRVYFHFYTDAAQSPGTELYSCSESINVYQNLMTDVWRNDAATPYIKDGTFTLTSSIIRHTFFVDKDDPNASPTNEGTAYFPFDSVKSAVRKICSANDADMYTIVMLSDDDDYIDISPSSPLTLTIIGNNRTINAKRTAGRKGAVLRVVGENTAVTLKNVNITGGYGYMGGGIYNSGTLAVSGGTISGCSADYGGGVYSVGTLTMEGCTISGCTAKYSGGGVYSTGTLTMEGGAITNNTAKEYGGGAISVSGGTFTLTGGTISGCTATSASSGGGGIYIVGGTLSLDGCMIGGESESDGNSAKLGGGISLYGGTLTFTGSTTTIKNCTATTFGGGIYIKTAAAISNCTITNCTATYDGGGIYNNVTDASAVTKIENCEISGCKALGTSFGKGGGGIFNNTGKIELTDVNITGGGDETVQNAYTGGGILNKGTLTVTGGEITDCVAVCGGGIYTGGAGAAFSADGTTISSCTAIPTSVGGTGLGGGIYSDTVTASCTLADCIIQSCTAKSNSVSGGGGIYHRYGELIITGGEISRCTSNGGGGGIDMTYDSTSTKKTVITGTTVSECSARLGGGGLSIHSAIATVELTDCTVESCEVTDTNYGGGGISVSNGFVSRWTYVTVENCSVKSCTASFGSGILNADSNGDTLLSLKDSEVSGDVSARYKGSHLSLSGSTTVTDGVIDLSTYTSPTNSSVQIAGALSKSSVAAIKLGTAYAAGDTVLTSADASVYALTAADCNRFTLGNPYYIVLSSENGVLVSPDLYVSSGGSDTTGDGTQTAPFATLQKAIDTIESFGKTESDFTIHVSGTVKGNSGIGSKIANKITIKGTAGSATDILDGEKKSVVLLISAALSVELQDIQITNGASAHVGGIGLSGNAALTISDGTKICGNEVTNTNDNYSGGAIRCYSSKIEMNGGEISGNTSANLGGGIYLMGHTTFTMTGGTITGNTAATGGGGVAMLGSNSVFTMTGGEISGNSASGTKGGGGIYAYGGTLEMSGDAKISGNKTIGTGYGGGISLNDRATFTMTGGTISGNTARNGGGVSDERSSFTMTGGEISGNEANNGAGGVWIWNVDSPFKLAGGKIKGNKASSGGGVVCASTSPLEFTDGEISGNTAQDGGGINVSGGSLAMSGGRIFGNTAARYGGGVYTSSNSEMTGGTIGGESESDANTAQYGGGVFIYSDTFTMSGGTITGNKATVRGGGVSKNSDATFTNIGGTVSGNSPD